MQVPFVSRGLYNDVRRQLEQSEAERRRLLDLLLEKPKPIVREPSPVTVDQEESKNASPQASNPLDRVLLKFDRAYPKGTRPPSRFLAGGK